MVFALCLCGQPAPDRWKDLRFLVGEWTGEGGGKSTGQGAGAYSFLPELGGKILVRRNTADYPGNPPIHHEDVMTVYRESDNESPRAIYFDSEGHVIHYRLEIDAPGNTVRFISLPRPGEPRYRLTYHETAKDVVSGLFEIAPADKPDAFTKYLEWSARRSK
jgi:hypothetical protein